MNGLVFYARVKFVISIYFNARCKEHWVHLQSGSCVLLMCPFSFLFFSSFLLSSLIRCSSLIISSACTLPTSVLELAISSFFPHIGVYLTYNVVLLSAMLQNESILHIHMYPFFYRFFFHINHCRVFSRVPYTIQ